MYADALLPNDLTVRLDGSAADALLDVYERLCSQSENSAAKRVTPELSEGWDLSDEVMSSLVDDAYRAGLPEVAVDLRPLSILNMPGLREFPPV